MTCPQPPSRSDGRREATNLPAGRQGNKLLRRNVGITRSRRGGTGWQFINFLSHALKSGNETKFWLVLSKDLDEKLIPKIDEILKETDELVRIWVHQ
jgi:hypothetical protein